MGAAGGWGEEGAGRTGPSWGRVVREEAGGHPGTKEPARQGLGTRSPCPDGPPAFGPRAATGSLCRFKPSQVVHPGKMASLRGTSWEVRFLAELRSRSESKEVKKKKSSKHTFKFPQGLGGACVSLPRA